MATQQSSHNDEFISTQKAADLLGISIRSVQYWVEKGKLRAWKTAGGHRRITLESVRKLMDEQARAKAASHSDQQKTILIVEDEPELLEYYRIHINSWQFPVNIKTAEDGFEGLMQIGKYEPAIIITDLLMPNMDGFTMIQAIHDKLQALNSKIIVVTVLSPQEIKDQGGLPDDVVVFHKPIPLKNLRKVIQTCITANANKALA